MWSPVNTIRTSGRLHIVTIPGPADTPDPTQNGLLAILAESESKRLFPHLDLVRLSQSEALCESEKSPGYVYFPITGIVSLLYVLENGSSAEIAMVGNKGIVGIALFLGSDTTLTRAIVRNGGHAYRLKGQLLQEEFSRAGALQHLLLRYTQALLTQMAQTAVCNRHHGIEQQLCRWLLLSLDRLPSNELRLTQDLIANMLGVRRESVVAVAGRLQSAGLIHYSRGRITVLDRQGLEARACECYEVIRKEYRRLLPEATAE